MGGLSSILTGLVLAGIALWFFTVGGSLETALMFVVGALFLFWRGFHGAGFSGDNETGPLDFVLNPRGAVIDSAVDAGAGRLAEVFGGTEPAAEDQPKFDPDAIIARYIENRPDALGSGHGTGRPTFGRKVS